MERVWWALAQEHPAANRSTMGVKDDLHGVHSIQALPWPARPEAIEQNAQTDKWSNGRGAAHTESRVAVAQSDESPPEPRPEPTVPIASTSPRVVLAED